MNTAIQDLNDLARACGDGFPMPATANNGAVFEEPWQAHAFAMTLQLHEKGVFTWPEWATALTHEIRAGQTRGEASDGSLYYTYWLNALEQLVIAALFRGFSAGRDLSQADLIRVARDTIPLAVTMDDRLKELGEWARPRARPASVDTRRIAFFQDWASDDE